MGISHRQNRGRLLQAAVVAVCCLFFGFLLLAGIAIAFAQGSAACTLSSGRSIAVTSNGWSIALTSSKDTATIDTSGRKIVVGPNFVQIDGRRVATIDAATKSVDVIVARGEVTITGDGQAIGTFGR